MSLSDCPKCWDTPCTCGYEYKDWRIELIAHMINGILDYQDNRERRKNIINEIEFVLEKHKRILIQAQDVLKTGE